TFRYILFAGAFLVAIAGLLIQSYLAMGMCLAASLVLGICMERIDNLADEPFKKYNDKFLASHRKQELNR
ncbi:MAG: hypothetical protein JWN30_1396, partial [Bacilli bacterium]|nr:hypothetical protein [Bacilli bacterium]